MENVSGSARRQLTAARHFYTTLLHWTEGVRTGPRIEYRLLAGAESRRCRAVLRHIHTQLQGRRKVGTRFRA